MIKFRLLEQNSDIKLRSITLFLKSIRQWNGGRGPMRTMRGNINTQVKFLLSYVR